MQTNEKGDKPLDENGQEMESYVLADAARIGDKVLYFLNKEHQGYVKPAVPFGTKGVVVGHPRYTTCYGRHQGSLAKVSRDYESGEPGRPGFYEANRGTIVVLWEDGTGGEVSPHDVYPLDQTLKAARWQDKAFKEAFNSMIYVKDLPELSYYEGDIVELSQTNVVDETNLARVTMIDYNQLDDTGPVGKYPIYTITSVDPKVGGTTYVNDMSREMPGQTERPVILRLVEHGLHWMYEHDRENMKFKDLREEAAFFANMGYSVEHRNPNTGLFDFTIEEAIPYVKAGKACGIVVRPGMFGAGPHLTVQSFPKLPDLEMRMRDAIDFAGFEGGIVKREVIFPKKLESNSNG